MPLKPALPFNMILADPKRPQLFCTSFAQSSIPSYYKYLSDCTVTTSNDLTSTTLEAGMKYLDKSRGKTPNQFYNYLQICSDFYVNLHYRAKNQLPPADVTADRDGGGRGG